MASDWFGISVAPGESLLEPEPSWTRLDSGIAGLRLAGVDIKDGRQSVFEKTGTGQSTFRFRDLGGYLDMTSGAFLGDLLSAPIAVSIRDPFRDEWFPLCRHSIEEIESTPVRSKVKTDTVVTGVDALDYFSNYELIPGLAGFSNAALNAQGWLFYEDAGFDERINAVLEDCGWPVELSSIFTGNVICSESLYSSGDKVLQVIQEACDAELPTIANYYIDSRGLLQVHGRYAIFDPDAVSASASNWTFREWKAGDNEAAAADPGLGGTAKMQPPYAFQLSKADLRNAALAYPQNADQRDLSDYIATSESSRNAHGTRTWTAPNMQIAEETTIGLTAKAYCQIVSQFVVDNYAFPAPRIPQLTLGTEHPGGTFGAATWEMICEAQIGDRVLVFIGHPGGGGFPGTPYYIQGRTITLSRGPGSLDSAFPIVKATFDLSPVPTSNPFGGFS